MNEECYHLTFPSTHRVPILVSVPHAGTQFPEELLDDFCPLAIQEPEDTDWFVDRLYSFAPELGVSLITAKYSRYVIDLNRSPKGSALYPNQRPQTSLIPIQTFAGKRLYQRHPPDKKETQRRIEKYHTPYYQRLFALLEELKATFGQALFFDAHSIKHFIPNLHKEPFSELTLSDNNGACSHPQLVQKALKRLQTSSYTLSYNSFFLGGHLVRSMGQPHKSIYGLQLEVCQNIYMDENTHQYLPEKAAPVQNLLKDLFLDLIQTMKLLENPK